MNIQRQDCILRNNIKNRFTRKACHRHTIVYRMIYLFSNGIMTVYLRVHTLSYNRLATRPGFAGVLYLYINLPLQSLSIKKIRIKTHRDIGTEIQRKRLCFILCSDDKSYGLRPGHSRCVSKYKSLFYIKM
jgi:hypothetical protein